MPPFRRLLATTVTLSLLALPSTSSAAPALDGTFALPAKPQQLAAGPDGDVWVTIGDAGTDVARVAPDGAVTGFDAPTVSFPVGITAGPDGNLWVTQAGGVARIDPGDPAGATPFALPDIVDPRRIVTGPDGNLWTASGDKALRIPPADPATATSFTVPGMGARGIASGTDGRLWIVDAGGGRLVRMATDGTFTTTPVGGLPQEVAAGPAGQVAFTNPDGAHRVGRFTFGGVVDETPVGTVDPFGIVLGGDGAYWTADFAGPSLTRVTTTGASTSLPMPPGSGPRFLTAGPGGTLWVGLETAESVARVTGVTPPADGGGGPGGGDGGPGTPPAVDATAPRITRVSLSRRTFRAGRRLAPARRGRRGVGARLRLTSSEDARLRITVERLTAGRRHGRACVRPGRARRGARRCARHVRVGAVTVAAREGRNAVRFTGRLRGRTLRAARYRLRIVATDAAGNRSTERRVRLRIVRR
ncbi:MAG: hypothetical protein M0P31_03795 [Solirubrobacteraceae bacterium]|nr:hypothetical protein [Solirubrobacteraceae bacterium]